MNFKRGIFILGAVLFCLSCSEHNIQEKKSIEEKRYNLTLRVPIQNEIAQGNTEKARGKLKKYLKNYPSDEMGWNIYGNLLTQLDSLNEAKKIFNNVISLNDTIAHPYMGLGLIARKQKNFVLSEKFYIQAKGFAKVAAKKHKEYEIIYIKSLQGLATVKYKQEKIDSTISLCDQILELDSSHVETIALLSICHFVKQDFDKSTHYFGKAKKLNYSRIEGLKNLFEGTGQLND